VFFPVNTVATCGVYTNISWRKEVTLRHFATLGAVLASQCCLAGTAHSQEIRPRLEVAKPRFEVASIKLNPWTNEGRVGVFTHGNVLTAEHVDLYHLVEFAYGLPPDSYQLSGGPGWARSGVLDNVSGAESLLFQVTAKAGDGARPSVEEFRHMLQSLLADRFQLQVHRTVKAIPVFNLVVIRDGPKLKESGPDAKESLAMRDGRVFRMRATHVPLTKLVNQLSNPNHGAGRPVFDRTELGGFYDFEIEWARNDLLAGSDGQVPEVSGSSVFSALKRLGLKLEPGTAPMETVVIDHAEKPTEN
jgi:uncharacterized protein (TIGR03435 family)